MKGYLILCTDGDCTTTKLVNQESWDWFMQHAGSPSGDDKPPEAQIVRNALANQCSEEEAETFLMCDPISGSFANDIALQLCSDDFDGETFDDGTIAELFAFCNQHGITIADQYMGMIY